MNVTIYTGPKDMIEFEQIERISFVNSDSFGPGNKVGNLTHEGLDDVLASAAVLVVNVNSFVAMEVSV